MFHQSFSAHLYPHQTLSTHLCHNQSLPQISVPIRVSPKSVSLSVFPSSVSILVSQHINVEHTFAPYITIFYYCTVCLGLTPSTGLLLLLVRPQYRSPASPSSPPVQVYFFSWLCPSTGLLLLPVCPQYRSPASPSSPPVQVTCSSWLPPHCYTSMLYAEGTLI